MLSCHTSCIFERLEYKSNATYIFEYTSPIPLKPNSVTKEGYWVYNSKYKEEVPLRDVVYYPDTNTVALYIATDEVYDFEYDLLATAKLQYSNGESAVLSQKCYPSYEYSVPYDTVSVLGIEYTKDGRRIYNLYGKTNFSALIKIVNNSKQSYDDLSYIICINNDLSHTIQSGCVSIVKDDYKIIQCFISDYIMELNDEITVLFNVNEP